MDATRWIAWALGDLAAGRLAAARNERERTVEAFVDRLGDVADLREAIWFAFEGTRRFLDLVGAEEPAPDPAAVGSLGAEAILEAAGADAGPEDRVARALAAFGRTYLVHHPVLSALVRPACPELAHAGLARAGLTPPEEAGAERPLPPAERSAAIAAALGTWNARTLAIEALGGSHGEEFSEVLLSMYPRLGPASPVACAARYEEAVRLVESAGPDSSEGEFALAREAVRLAGRGVAEVPVHLVVRAVVADAARQILRGDLAGARDRLFSLADRVEPEELDRGAEILRERAGDRLPSRTSPGDVRPAGSAFESLMRDLAPPPEPAEGESEDPARIFAAGTQHRAVVEEFELDDVLVSLRSPGGAVARGRLEPSGWRWPEEALERRPAARPGDSVVVEIDLPPGPDLEARVVAVDPWERFLPDFLRRNQDRLLQGRIAAVEPERLILSIIDRLVGEPEGILGELPIDAMDLEAPFPLELFFEEDEVLPVLVEEIDAEDGWLTFGSPWIDRDPWDEGYVARKYRPGNAFRGTVVRLEADWVGVQVEPGIVARMPRPSRGQYALIVPVEVVVAAIDESARIIHVRRKL